MPANTASKPELNEFSTELLELFWGLRGQIIPSYFIPSAFTEEVRMIWRQDGESSSSSLSKPALKVCLQMPATDAEEELI